MEENKTEVNVTEKKEEKKESFFGKVKAFMKNPAKGRPIKNAGWMLGGAGALMLIASLVAGKNNSNDETDYEEEEE